MIETPEISVVIPVYNSEQTIQILLERLEVFFLEKKITYEIILVDDSSSDNTWDKICEVAKKNAQIKGIQLAHNSGQFIATVFGISKSTGKYILNMDDDLEHTISEIEILYNKLKSNNSLEIVFGMSDKKYLNKGKIGILSKRRNQFLNFIWNKYPTDSFRIFRREMVFKNNKFLVSEPMLELYLQKSVSKSKVAYAEIHYGKRLAGHSGYNFWKKLKIFLQYTPNYLSKKYFLLATFILVLALTTLDIINRIQIFIILAFYLLYLLFTNIFISDKTKRLVFPKVRQHVNL